MLLLTVTVKAFLCLLLVAADVAVAAVAVAAAIAVAAVAVAAFPAAASTDDEADYALHALDLSPVCFLDNVARSSQKPSACLWLCFLGPCFCFIK